MRGSYEEGSWTSHLAKFGLTGIKAAALMQDLVASCLNEHDETILTQGTTRRVHHAESRWQALGQARSRPDPPAPASPLRQQGRAQALRRLLDSDTSHALPGRRNRVIGQLQCR